MIEAVERNELLNFFFCLGSRTVEPIPSQDRSHTSRRGPKRLLPRKSNRFYDVLSWAFFTYEKGGEGLFITKSTWPPCNVTCTGEK